MHASTIQRNLVRVASIVSVAILSSIASSQATWAWTQTFAVPGVDTTVGAVAVDASENAYSLVSLGNGTSNFEIELRAFNADGSARFTVPVVTTSTTSNVGQILVTPPVEGIQSILTSVSYTDLAGHQDVRYSKFNTFGALQWNFTLSGGSGKVYPLGIDADSAGNIYIAAEGNSPEEHLQVLELSAAGKLVANGTNFRIWPAIESFPIQASHQPGYWLVNGLDTLYTGGHMWGAFDDKNAVIKTFRTYIDKTVNGVNTSYGAVAYPYNGNILSYVEVVTTKLQGTYTPVYQHTITDLTSTGSEIWESALQPHPIYSLATAPGGGQVYFSEVEPQGGTYLAWLDGAHIEHRLTLPVPIGNPFLIADSSGVFVAYWNWTGATSRQTYVKRYAPDGILEWSYLPMMSWCGAFVGDGGNLWVAGNGNPSSSFSNGSVTRFVTGFALSAMSANPTKLTGTTPTTITATFAGSASVAGTITFHSYDSDLLLQNGQHDMTVNYNPGTISVAVTAHGVATRASSVAEVGAVCNGVHRATYVTLSAAP